MGDPVEEPAGSVYLGKGGSIYFSVEEEWRKHQKEAGNPPESAEKLLERIKQEREEHYQKQLAEWKKACEQAEAEGKKKPTKPKKPKDLPPLTEEELADLPELPECWLYTKLESISVKITDGEHFRPKTLSNGVYFLSAKDIKESGVSLSDPLYISKEDAKKARLRCNPDEGDVLIVSRGATVGRTCIVNTKNLFCLLGSVILIKLNYYINNKYIYYLLTSPSIKRELIKLSGSTAQQAIYLRDIKNVAIPVASHLEQTQIVSEIESRLSVCDQLEKSIEDSLNKTEALRQSILKKAFSGELTKEWREEHPELISGENSAEKLLERITAEKKRMGSRKAAKNAT